MQLSKKVLQTTLSVIKLKVTPSDHPFKQTKWFWQNISFQNCPMKNSASIVAVATKIAKECLEHLNVPYAKWIVGKVLNSWLTQKEKTEREKNCNKNKVLSKEKLKCRHSADRVMLQVLNKVRKKLKPSKTT